MSDIDDLNDAIVAAAQTPAEVEVDGERVQSRGIDELVKAAEYVRRTSATSDPFGTLRTKALNGGGAWQ